MGRQRVPQDVESAEGFDSTKYVYHSLSSRIKDGDAHTIYPTVWKRLEPKLVDILETRKAKRLANELESRLNDRRREASVRMSVLARESRERGDHGRLGARGWEGTFPSGDELYNLPSVAALIAQDSVPITEEVFKSRERDILAEAKVHQMRDRHILAAKTAKQSEGVSDTIAEGSPDNEPSEDILRATDEHNITILCDPTIFFSMPFSFVKIYSIRNYPEVIDPYSGTSLIRGSSTKVDSKYLVYNAPAHAIATAIIEASPSINALDRSVLTFQSDPNDKRFVCLCCPKTLRLCLSWQGLVNIQIRLIYIRARAYLLCTGCSLFGGEGMV